MKKSLKKILVCVLIVVLAVLTVGAVSVGEPQSGTVKLYNDSGDIKEVKAEEAESQSKDGWHQNFSDATTVMWSTRGDTVIVFNSDVEEYEKVGWYKNKEDVVEKVYASDGEEREVFKDEVELYTSKGWKKMVNGKVVTGKPMVALTYDDGPRKENTKKLLDCLEENGAKATFFMLGNCVDIAPENVKRMKELGMEIGSHTWDHSQLTKLSESQVKKQIDDTNAKLKAVCGSEPTVLRPPYGAHNSTVDSVAGVPIILWNVDTLDWKTKNANSTYEAIMSSVSDGDIILMHDIHDASVEASLRVIPELIKRGYQLVTVSEMGKAKLGDEYKAGKVYTDFN